MDRGTGDPVWYSDSPASRVAVIAALELEARLVRRLAAAGRGSVYVSGPGAARAFATASRAVAEGAAGLVSWGLAGGLSAEASTARLLMPDSIRNGSGEWRADDGWCERLGRRLGASFDVLTGSLYSAERVLTTPREKSELRERSGAVAVDMESAAIARAASEAGVPFLALRAIADGAGDELPQAVESLVTADGRARYAGLLRYLASPRQLRLLLALAASSGRARRVLGRVAHSLMQSVQ